MSNEFLQWKVLSQLIGSVNNTSLTMGSGASQGSSFVVNGARGIAVQVPAVWTAADISVEVSNDDATWLPVKDNSGNLIKITNVGTAVASVYVFPATVWPVGAFTYARFISIDTADETAENQGGARTLVASRLY